VPPEAGQACPFWVFSAVGEARVGAGGVVDRFRGVGAGVPRCPLLDAIGQRIDYIGRSGFVYRDAARRLELPLPGAITSEFSNGFSAAAENPCTRLPAYGDVQLVVNRITRYAVEVAGFTGTEGAYVGPRRFELEDCGLRDRRGVNFAVADRDTKQRVVP